jgi:surface antigen
MRAGGHVFAVLAGLVLAGCTSFGSGSVDAPARALQSGGLAAGELGAGLDERDRKLAADAEYRALEFGRLGVPVTWLNKKSGHHGEVVPGAGYRINTSSCRDYTHAIYDDGPPKNGRGTACRQDDGSWKPIL